MVHGRHDSRVTPPTLEGVARAALAGGLATVAMTVAMQALFPALPPREQRPLPPRLITDAVRERVGLPRPDEDSAARSALLAHIAFGVAAGVPLALWRPRSGVEAAAAGMAYGAGVWTVAYLGLLPGLGLLPSATRQPRGRVALMVAAHLVWGSAAGYLTYRTAPPPDDADPHGRP